jgi:oligosaccharide repeat unit polymerase
MSILDLVILFFILLVVLNYRAHRSVLFPPFIFCALWLLDLLVFRLGLIEINPVHGNTLAIVTAGAALFSLGGLIAGLVPRTLLRIHVFPLKPKESPGSLRRMLMLVLLCGLPIMFYQIWSLSRMQGGGFNILAQAHLQLLEIALSGEPSQSFVLDHFVTIAIGTSLLFATEKRDRAFWIVTVVAFIGGILGTGRGPLLLLIPGLSAIYMLQAKQESLFSAMRFLRWPIALFLVFYIGLIFVVKTPDGASGSIASIAAQFFFGYISGPLAAFDYVVQHPADFMTTTSHVFQFPLSVAASLHLISGYTKPPQFDSFVYIPFQMNVYTVYKFDFVEIGVIGTMALIAIIGAFHSLLYLKARQGGRLSTYLFAYSMYTVLMVIFDDHYYTIGGYLRALALGLTYLTIGSMPFHLVLISVQKRRAAICTPGPAA